MKKEKSLNPKEKSILKKSNSQKNFMKNTEKLNIDLTAYNWLSLKNNNKLKKNLSLNKNKNTFSTEPKSKQNKECILYQKFLEFKEKNKKSNSKPNYKIGKISKTKTSLSLTSASSNKNKTKKKVKIKSIKNNKITSPKKNNSFIKKKSAKIINKNELFSQIINNTERDGKDLTNIKSLKRNNSCQFNNVGSIKDFNLNNTDNKTRNNLVKSGSFNKIKKKKKNNTLNLISQKYFEKMKFNKYKYYNLKNNNYINERRKRVEEKLNDILYEKYKIIRPLKMTERIFFIDNEPKTDKNINKLKIDNNMCKILNNNNIINNLNFNMFFYLDNYKDNYINNNDKQKEKNCSNSAQIIYYKNHINDIIKMRRDLCIEDFFRKFRRDYNLLDFNFTFLFQHPKNEK